MDLQELKAIYEKYRQDYEDVRAKAAPFDGFLGFGADPRKDPCHVRFYESVEQWVREFLSGDPDGQTAYQAAHWILTAAEAYSGKPESWFMLAAHGLCRDLIPLLSCEECARLEKLYDENHPRWERTPVQKEIYKLLHKGARKR